MEPPVKDNIQTERKIHTAQWMIFTRWFYPVGVLAIGLVTKIFSSGNASFSYGAMATIFVVYLLLNFAFRLAIGRIQKNYSSFFLSVICHGLIASDLIFFAYIMHLAGGVESFSNIFFFLPIVSASLLFGAKGSVLTALLSGLIINFLVLAEYHQIIPHIQRYGLPTIEFTDLSTGLTKTIINAIFFLVTGLFSGYGANLLFRREKSFKEKSRQLDEQTKKIRGQEAALAAANAKLEKKIKELSGFQNLAVDRELRMIELKKELASLKEKNNLL